MRRTAPGPVVRAHRVAASTMSTESNARTLPPPPNAPSMRCPARHTGERGVVLTVLEGPDKGKRVRIESVPSSIGSADDNQLTLEDRYVSRYHCELTESVAGLILRDRGSRNGTFLNGVQVIEAAIEPGAEIRLGESVLVVDFEDERAKGRSEPDVFGDLAGVSPAMRDAIGVLRTISPTALTCLIMGETGTGKELAARAIHANSGHASGPFVVIDCGAVGETLIEDKLFGHQRGAFTGAVADAPGAIEAANGGSIFLDEIGDLPIALQPKLLRVLERREITRLGSHRAISVNVRVVAATHRNVLTMVKEGKFREDLYYRLSEATVWLPPLRSRIEDIELLARRLLEQSSAGLTLEPEAIRFLEERSWSGNVRELRNVLRRAAAQSPGRPLTVNLLKRVLEAAKASFPPADAEITRPFATGTQVPPPNPVGAGLRIAEARDAHRKEYLQRLREQYGNDDLAIAVHMGVNIKYARRLLKRFGIA